MLQSRTDRSADIAAVRESAAALLEQLHAARTSADQRLQESGRRDPMRCVTGASALDGAIDDTRDLIARIDEQLNGESAPSTAVPFTIEYVPAARKPLVANSLRRSVPAFGT